MAVVSSALSAACFFKQKTAYEMRISDGSSDVCSSDLIDCEDRAAFADMVARHGLVDCAQRIARPTTAPQVRVLDDGEVLASWHWEELFGAWWSVTHAMQRLRDNPESADEERAATVRFDAPGLRPKLGFDPAEDTAPPFIAPGARPKPATPPEHAGNRPTDNN